MKKILITLFLISLSTEAFASIKSNIIQNIKNIKNFSFDFEQNINGKIENGSCTIEYPKKIFCDYSSNNNKILVSNGKSLVIKTNASYYLYPLERTPLNLILDKSFLVKKIIKSNERIIDDKFINFTFNEQENEINIFFDKKTFNLIGWQTLDVYQNLNFTFLSDIVINQEIEANTFKLPKLN